MSLPGANIVIDISHYTKISSVSQVKSDGVVAVVCKATEGDTVIDKTYQKNKSLFKNAGFKWGSYHFSSGASVVDQVENYIHNTNPEPDELICLDFEPSFHGPNMTLQQLEEFVNIIHQELGRYPCIYGGSLLRETVKNGSDPVLLNCPLWYAYYPTQSDQPIAIPKPWSTWTLWQYTDGNHGPQPQSVKGIGNCDRDTFKGTQADLIAQWPFT